MIEFTNVAEISLIKTDLGLEKEMASLLGGGGDPNDYYSAYLDESVLDHFSATWVVQAPVSAWREIDGMCAISPLEMMMDEDVYYVPGESDGSDESELVVSHLEKNTEDAVGMYQDMIEAGVSEETASLVLPANQMKKKLVTMTASDLIASLRSISDGNMSSETSTIILGMGQAFNACAPIITSILGGENAFKGD